MFLAGTSAEDTWRAILWSNMPMLVTLFHFAVDNSAEPVVTKCLEYALDVQCAVVTCHLLSIISLLDRYLLQQLWGKREISGNKIPYIIAEFGVGYCLMLRKAKRGTAGETAYWLQRYRTVYCITSNQISLVITIPPGKLNTVSYFLLSWRMSIYLFIYFLTWFFPITASSFSGNSLSFQSFFSFLPLLLLSFSYVI